MRASATFDFVIAGAGVVGVHVARCLLQQHVGCSVALLDRAYAAGSQASAANSGVLHAGVYYGTDSHKAAFCVKGNAAMKEFCQRTGVPLLQCGKLIVLTQPERSHHVTTILQRAAAAGAELHDISKREALALEPLVNCDAQRFLWAPSSAVASPPLYFRALLQDTLDMAGNRLRIITDCSVTSVVSGGGGVTARLDDGSAISCRHVFNCAGTGALALAKASGFGAKFLELPFRGMYFKVKGFAPKRLLYPVPDLTAPFLGVHWTIDASCEAKLGPSAMFTLADVHHPAPPPSLQSVVKKFGSLMAFVVKQPQLALAGAWDARKALRLAVWHEARQLTPGLQLGHVTSERRWGIRSQLMDRQSGQLVMDFRVEGDSGSTHALNVVSPGWTCSQPFAEHIVDDARKRYDP